MPKKKKKQAEFSGNVTMDESTQLATHYVDVQPQPYEQFTDKQPSYSERKIKHDESLLAYNDTFQDEEPKIVVFGKAEQNTSEENIIGKVIVRKGRVIKYEIDSELLWKQVLRIIYHRIQMSRGTACLLNLRTISKQLTRECNIKSIAAVEGEVIKLMSDKFGVKDIDSPKEPRGLKKLRGTAEFWGTVGSRTKHNRKRVARVYAVTNPQKIIEYIEGVLDVKG